MKMTIEELIESLTTIRNKICSGKYGTKTSYTFEQTLDIIRKYQTMQKVLEKVWNVPSCMLDEEECLNKIMETYKTVR